LGGTRWLLEEIPTLRGYTVEWAEPRRLILSRRHRLFLVDGTASAPRLLGSFPAAAWRRLAARSRIAQRLLRFMFYNVLCMSDGSVFVTFDKFAGVLDGNGLRVLEGVARPCRVLRGACAVDRDGSLYFGEYLNNAERHEVHVYRYAVADRRTEIVHTFPAGSVRHVHGIYFDPHTDSLWCLTGDNGKECRVLRTRDGFRTIEAIGQGDETWRCVSVLFTKDSLYYATDAEFRQNVIYRMDRKSGSRAVIQEVDGPVYYSAAVGDDLFFAVTAELCPSQTSRSATLWNLNPEGTCSPIASILKDRLPVGYFMPGTLHFPLGPGLAGELIFHGVGLIGFDNRTYMARRVAS